MCILHIAGFDGGGCVISFATSDVTTFRSTPEQAEQCSAWPLQLHRERVGRDGTPARGWPLSPGRVCSPGCRVPCGSCDLRNRIHVGLRCVLVEIRIHRRFFWLMHTLRLTAELHSHLLYSVHQVQRAGRQEPFSPLCPFWAWLAWACTPVSSS